MLVECNYLMVRLLKAKYLCDYNFLESVIGDNPSPIWCSIWNSKGALMASARAKIGDDQPIKIWNSP